MINSVAMSTVAIEIRLARPDDATAIAAVHDAAWRHAYRGLIPGRELERMVERRGPRWWSSAILRRSRISLLTFDRDVAGYASYGRNRVSALPFESELYEIYLKPEYQGLGLGRRLFQASRRDLASHNMKSTIVWALADNEQACGFYRRMGGKPFDRGAEKFGTVSLPKIAFVWLTN